MTHQQPAERERERHNNDQNVEKDSLFSLLEFVTLMRHLNLYGSNENHAHFQVKIKSGHLIFTDYVTETDSKRHKNP